MRGIVWAYVAEDANQKLLEIEEDYNRLGIPTHKKVMSQSISSYIIFENDDMWRVVRASDSGRGYAANVSYIDRRISQEIINTIIKPATKSWPYQAFRFYLPRSYVPTREDEKIDTKYI
jgi:hypothetical protein